MIRLCYITIYKEMTIYHTEPENKTKQLDKAQTSSSNWKATWKHLNLILENHNWKSATPSSGYRTSSHSEHLSYFTCLLKLKLYRSIY